MPDKLNLLADPQVSGRSLFVLKRIAEALRDGWLTPEQARAAVEPYCPDYREAFACADGKAERKAAQIVRAVETVLQRRFPTRFRAEIQPPKAKPSYPCRAHSS
jgi:hypothetical protein